MYIMYRVSHPIIHRDFHVVFEKFLGKQCLDLWESSTEQYFMMLPVSKNITFIKIIRLFTLKSGQDRKIYSVKLDDIGYG